MDHELWNELGNLYFMNGAYEPAIHAYMRSIELDGEFGRPYTNLAMAYVQVGKFSEAIRLYRHGIELLTDDKEKAIARKRLGLLYRQLMENDHAFEFNPQLKESNPKLEEDWIAENETGTELPFSISIPDGSADTIMTALNFPEPEKDEVLEINAKFELSEVENDVDDADPAFPFSVSLPEMDINASLAESDISEADEEEDELEDINASLELVEEETRISWFENDFVPPNPEPSFPSTEALQETILNIQSDWRLAYTEEMTSIEMTTQVEDELKIDEDLFGKFEMIVPIDLQIISDDGVEAESLLPESDRISESVQASDVPAEVQYEVSSLPDSMNRAELSEVQAEPVEYSQVEYPLMELSDAERNTLEMDIAKYKYAAHNNPRNYAIWEMLGDAYKAVGKYKDAIKAFQTAISINSTKPSFYYRLGLIHAIEGRDTDAAAAFQRVLEIDPNYAQAHASLASYYRKIGLDEVANEHIEKALSTNFEEASEYNLACLEAICGNSDRALELLEVALQNKQAYLNWAQADPDLDSLRKDRRFHDLLHTYATN